MKIYILRGDISGMYKTLNTTDSRWKDTIFWFKGEKRCYNWEPLKVEYSQRDQILPTSDCLNFIPSLPIFSQHAVNILSSILEKYGELLPLIHDKDTLFAYNVTNVLSNALNDSESQFTFGKRTGVITSIKKYVFNSKVVIEQMIFKIEQDNKTSVFVNDDLKKLVETNKLKGFDFRLVWQSDTFADLTN